MNRQFLDKLHNFALAIDFDFENVNFGGCCPVAVALAKHLKTYFPDVKFLVATYSGCVQDLNTVRSNIKRNVLSEWNENGIYFCHVLLEFSYDGKLYQLDTEEGLVERRELALGRYEILKGYLSFEDAEELANRADWNAQFDRGQLPTIYKAIDKFFRKNKPD